MFYTVYRVTNTKTNHYYVGLHRTHDLNDNYLGSGVRIKAAVARYGERHFTKKYLGIFDNPHDMIALEREIVDEHFIRLRETYNCQLGGRGACGQTL